MRKIAPGKPGRRQFHFFERAQGCGQQDSREHGTQNDGHDAKGEKDGGKTAHCLAALGQVDTDYQGRGLPRHIGFLDDAQGVRVESPFSAPIHAGQIDGFGIVEYPTSGQSAEVRLVVTIGAHQVASLHLTIFGYCGEKVTAPRASTSGGVERGEVAGGKLFG